MDRAPFQIPLCRLRVSSVLLGTAIPLLCAQPDPKLYPVDQAKVRSLESTDKIGLDGLRKEIGDNNKAAIELITRYKGEFGGLMGLTPKDRDVITTLEHIKQFLSANKSKPPESLSTIESVQLYRLAQRTMNELIPLDLNDEGMFKFIMAVRRWAISRYPPSWFAQCWRPFLKLESFQGLSRILVERRVAADGMFDHGDWEAAALGYAGLLPTGKDVEEVISTVRKAYMPEDMTMSQAPAFVSRTRQFAPRTGQAQIKQVNWDSFFKGLSEDMRIAMVARQEPISAMYRDRIEAIRFRSEDAKCFADYDKGDLTNMIKLLGRCRTIAADPRRKVNATFGVDETVQRLRKGISAQIDGLPRLQWIAPSIPSPVAPTEAEIENSIRSVDTLAGTTDSFIKQGLAYQYLTNAEIDEAAGLGLLSGERKAEITSSMSSLAAARSFSQSLASSRNTMMEAKALARLKTDAALGKAEAQLALGERYIKGLGVEKSNYQALKWFLKASAQGNVDASGWVLSTYNWLRVEAGRGETEAMNALASIPGHAPKRNLIQDFRFHKNVIGYFPNEFSDHHPNFIVVQVLKVVTVKAVDRVGNKVDRAMIYGLSNVAAGGTMVFDPPKWITNWVELICVNKSSNGQLSLQTDQFQVGKSYLIELSSNGNDPTYYPTPSPNIFTILQAWATAEGNLNYRRPLSRAPIQMIRLPNGKVEN